MNYTPLTTDKNVLVMPGAVVCGNVDAGEGTVFWFNSVCRAEIDHVTIGKRTNVQDNATIHNETHIGDDVTIGHNAVVHGCTVGDRVLIGMGAIILDGARIGDDCIVGAGAVCTGKLVAPAGSMILGAPAKVVRPLTEKEIASLLESSREYSEKAAQYRKAMQI